MTGQALASHQRADLSDAEIDSICEGLTQNAAKVRFLQRLGLHVERRPNGRPLVARSEWERRLTRMEDPAWRKGSVMPKWTR